MNGLEISSRTIFQKAFKEGLSRMLMERYDVLHEIVPFPSLCESYRSKIRKGRKTYELETLSHKNRAYRSLRSRYRGKNVPSVWHCLPTTKLEAYNNDG